MQRTSDAMEDQRDVGGYVDVSELIARISAERTDSFGRFDDAADDVVHVGDDHGYDDDYDEYAVADATPSRQWVGVNELTARIAAERSRPLQDTGEQRRWVGVNELTARIAAERARPLDDAGEQRQWVGVNELTARIAAERGRRDPLGHRLQTEPGDGRWSRRRMAPVVAGVATVLVATTVALTLRSGDAPEGPELNAALVGASAPSPAAVQVPAPIVPPGPAVVAPAPVIALPSPAVAVPRTGLRSVAPVPPRAVPKPARAVDEGVQAATQNGWKLVDRDEFTGAVGAKWSRYDGEGNDGEGRRSPDAISVRDGAAVIRGDADGTTGGMAWRDSRRTGRWEMRARFPKGDAQYHPVLLLWPGDGGSDDGEIDFAETTSAASSVSFFLHHGSGDQETAKKQLDLTQWHNYAVEVTADRVTGYVDGQKWFESTDRDTLPREAVHPVIQLDWFPKGDSPEPTELQVDWMRIYQ